MTVGQENSLNQWAVQKYDAVSKAAFDVRDNVQLRKTVESAESFNAGVVKIMKDAGIPDKFLVGLGGEDVGTTEWLATVEGLAEAGAELAADTAISGFLTYIGQPQWIPAAVGGGKKKLGHSKTGSLSPRLLCQWAAFKLPLVISVG